MNIILSIIGLPLKVFAYLIFILPYPFHAGIASMIAFIWFDLLRIRRKDAIRNVKRVFPQMSDHDAAKMARKSLFHMGLTLVEFVYMPFMNGEKFRKFYDVEGEEHLQKAFLENKGVFGISLHLGNGDLASAALASWKYPIHIISKVFKTKWLNEFWFSARKKKGIRFIAPRKSSYEILKALKANELVVFVLDQYTGPPNGILTTFFGIETGTAVGLSLFAQRSGSVVLPLYTYRIGPKKHKIVIKAPIPFEEKATKEETLRYMTQKYNTYVEEAILEYPEQWMWVHRRWKLGFEGQNFNEETD